MEFQWSVHGVQLKLHELTQTVNHEFASSIIHTCAVYNSIAVPCLELNSRPAANSNSYGCVVVTGVHKLLTACTALITLDLYHSMVCDAVAMLLLGGCRFRRR